MGGNGRISNPHKLTRHVNAYLKFKKAVYKLSANTATF